jgi:hypothetical protein
VVALLLYFAAVRRVIRTGANWVELHAPSRGWVDLHPLKLSQAASRALVAEVVDVLLEATPRGVDLDQVRGHIEEVPGVVEVHDLHAWTITSGIPSPLRPGTVDACIAQGRPGRPRPARRVPRGLVRRRPLHLPTGA